MTMFQQKIKTIALACAAFGAVSAQAGTLTFNSFADGSQLEQSELAVNMVGGDTAKGGHREVDDGAAAGFNVTYADGTGSSKTFTSYCIDLDGYAGFDDPTAAYTSGPAAASSKLTATQSEDIGKLYTVANAGGDINTQNQYAAFQLAVWEIVYEGTTTGPYSLSTGDWTGTPGTPQTLDDIEQTLATQATFDLANTWLAALPTTADMYSVFVLDHGTSALHFDDGTTYDYQDQVYAVPTPITAAVPEPSTYALMLAGLAGAGFIARRKAAAKR
jgi:PEP-CTERM motif